MQKKTVFLLGVLSLTLLGAGCKATTEVSTTPEEPAMENKAMEGDTMEKDAMMQADFTATHKVILDESTLNWAGEKITGNGHFGTINLTEGTLAVDEAGMITNGSFTFDMTTLSANDVEGKTKTSVETHLKSDDFFDVENHPTGTFVITSTEKTETGLIVTGDLTLKGITKSVSFPATLQTTGDAMLSTADITLDRTLWDIKFGSGKFFSDLGDNLIKDEMTISLEIEAEKI